MDSMDGRTPCMPSSKPHTTNGTRLSDGGGNVRGNGVIELPRVASSLPVGTMPDRRVGVSSGIIGSGV